MSGPGALSQRTDGRPQPVRDLPDAEYGANSDYREFQQGAPLAGAPSATTPAGGAPAPSQPLVGMGDPTTMPGTPVTDGAAAGPGAGMDALNLPQMNARSELERIGKYLPVLIRQADSPDATPAFRAYVRWLQGGAV